MQRATIVAVLALLLASTYAQFARAETPAKSVSFSVAASSAVADQPLTGRMFVAISRDAQPEPRFALSSGSFVRHAPPFFGVDVSALQPGKKVAIGDAATGFPLQSLRDLPPGDYYVQALLNVYTEFRRADGHVIWAHMDQWEGQNPAISPGNLVSEVKRVRLDPRAGFRVELELTRVLPPIELPADTKWLRHMKFQSPMLTKFWGRPIYLGATVLLPQGYDEHPDVHYPVLYEQTHFDLDRMLFGFATEDRPLTPAQRERSTSQFRESPYEMYKTWSGPDFPRMIVVVFQHPTPYYDDSYAVNSANNGPYGDAIIKELIPYVEERFRIIRKPYARMLRGGSTGGWEALALHLQNPDFFGGSWPICPDPVDFRHFVMVNIYEDDNAFVLARDNQLQSPVGPWFQPERFFSRGPDGQPFLTMRQQAQREEALGTRGRSSEQFGAWEATFGPVGPDGYPVQLFDRRTGKINREVAHYWRDNGYDLRAYLEKNWATLAPKIDGKIHLDVGDMDNYFLNLAVYDLQALFDAATHPPAKAKFYYSRPMKGHGWQHTTTAGILREMAAHISANAPPGENTSSWQY